MRHNFPKEFEYITIETPNLPKNKLKELFRLCIDAEIEIGDGAYSNREYPYTSFCSNQLIKVTKIDLEDVPVTFEEFKLFIQGKGKYKPQVREFLQLNDEYTAEVTKQRVKVGRSIFTHEKIARLYKLSQKP